MTDFNVHSFTERDHRFSLVIAVILTVVGCSLLIAGFCVPPTGEIHSSALIAYGEIMTFVAALLGINQHYKSIITKILNEKRNTDAAI